MRAQRMLVVRDARAERTGPNTWPEDPVEVLRVVYPRLRAAARTVDAAGAEDLVQEALVAVLARHPDFRGLAHPLGYAKVTMFRLAYRKRLRRWTEVPLEVLERLDAMTEPDPADHIAERLRARDALAALGPKQRACLVLRYVEGVDDAGIAEILGCGPSTVRSQITRALARMRVVLDDSGEVDDREP